MTPRIMVLAVLPKELAAARETGFEAEAALDAFEWDAQGGARYLVSPRMSEEDPLLEGAQKALERSGREYHLLDLTPQYRVLRVDGGALDHPRAVALREEEFRLRLVAVPAAAADREVARYTKERCFVCVVQQEAP